jgi:hypothetical protein
MHTLQAEINATWREAGLPEFGLGLGLSTGEAAAALLGSAERLEYTLVGDTVNMSQRLQQFASAGETVISAATRNALATPVSLTALPPQLVKGRETPVLSFKIDPYGTAWPPEGGQAQPAETPPAPALAAETPAPEAPALEAVAEPPMAGSEKETGVAETAPLAPATAAVAETSPAETARAAGTAEREFAPAEAPQKAEGNRKWKIWKSRNGTR